MHNSTTHIVLVNDKEWQQTAIFDIMNGNMKTHTRHWLSPQILVIALLCMSASFGIGVKTTGDVQTVDHLQAEETVRLTGDMNADAVVDLADAIVVLEIVRGEESASPEQLLVEPTGDKAVTIEDALRILRDIHSNTIL